MPKAAADISWHHLADVCVADAVAAGDERGSQSRAFMAPQSAEDATLDAAHRPPARLRMASVKFGQVQAYAVDQPHSETH